MTSDQSLIAESVRTALVSRGCDASVVPWPDAPGSRPRPPGPEEPPDVVLLMCELESAAAVRQARTVASHMGTRSILLTGAPKGPLWGAVLHHGVDVVMPLSTTLEELLAVFQGALEGTPLMDDDERQELARQWQTASADRRAWVEKMNTLTPRERTVLRLLHLGEPVPAIAGLLGVSQATVRSQVRAVLRKLGVSSQLAAVAGFDSVQGCAEPGHRLDA